MELRFAYNTNGTAHHRMTDAVALVADSGYDGIAVTLDHVCLDPMMEGWERRTEALAQELRRRGLGCVIESGARFLLDPRDKHQPTLVSATAEGRDCRLAFLRRSLDIAAMLDAEAMAFWAGSPKPEVRAEDAWDWLRAGVEQVLAHAGGAGGGRLGLAARRRGTGADPRRAHGRDGGDGAGAGDDDRHRGPFPAAA